MTHLTLMSPTGHIVEDGARVVLRPATAESWRDIARVRAAESQQEWVAETTCYLCLSADNVVALGLCRSVGFVETGELSDDEIVLRRPRP